MEVVKLVGIKSLYITLRASCKPMCSLGDAPFDADVKVGYTPRNGVCVEIVSFEEWIQEFGSNATTVEQLASMIFDGFEELVKPQFLAVEVSATTTVHRPVVVKYERTFL